jgi:hypothetical protein
MWLPTTPILQNCTTLHIAQHCTLHNIAQHCTTIPLMQHCTTLHNIALPPHYCNIAQHCTTLHNIAHCTTTPLLQHCTTLHYHPTIATLNIAHCTTLHYIAQHCNIALPPHYCNIYSPMCQACPCAWSPTTLTYRVGQNRMYTPYTTVCMVIYLLKIPYIHRMYEWFWPSLLT